MLFTMVFLLVARKMLRSHAFSVVFDWFILRGQKEFSPNCTESCAGYKMNL